jgi:hypothetical protein
VFWLGFCIGVVFGSTANPTEGLKMSISFDQLAMDGPTGPRRRSRTDRRVRSRLRELCEEVLASYRMAQGQDLVTPDEREQAEQMLRSLTPRLSR